MGKERPLIIFETYERLILDSSERLFYFTKKKLKYRAYSIFLVLVFMSLAFTLYSFFVTANIFNYYPSSCLGTWDSPQNVQNEPSLGSSAKSEEFNKDNSAFYDGGGSKQIFCGDFKSNGNEKEKIFKKAILKFSWAIALPTPIPTPVPVLEQSQFENQILNLPASASIIVIPDYQASISIPLESQTSEPTPNFQQIPLSSETPVITTEQPTPVPEILAPIPEPTPEPTPVLEPAPILEPSTTPVSFLKHFTFASIFSDIASDSVLPSASPTSSPTSSPIPITSLTPASISQPLIEPSFSPEITADPSPLFITTPSPANEPMPPTSSSPSVTPTSASYSLDDFLEVFYTTDGQNWQSLGRVNKNNFESLELEVPITSWEELRKLQISVTGVFTTDSSRRVYLDGIWVETQYEDIQQKMEMKKNELIKEEAQKLRQTKIDKSKIIKQSENKNDFRADEEPTFEIDTNFMVPASPSPGGPASSSSSPLPSVSPIPSPSISEAKSSIFLTWFEKLLKFRSARAQLNDQILIEMFDMQGQQTDIKPIMENINGKTVTRLPKSRAFKPGKYELRVLIIKNDEVYLTSQDFTWGVLAINPDKSIYLPNEVANLAFAVLDENGKMVCDTDLELTLDLPDGSQETLSVSNGRITVNPECQIKAVTYRPDYEAQYRVSTPGVYDMKLRAITKNGSWIINDSFEVRESVDFDVQRITATRIFPVNAYRATFNIKANRDYHGRVSEFVPDSFTIVEISGGGRMSEKRGEKEISWDVDFQTGQSYSLSYTYFSPTQSPQFYLLGPLKIGQFEEIRKWQIAVDDVIDSGDGQLVYSDGAKASYGEYTNSQTFGAFASISASTIVPIFADNEASPVRNEHMAAILNSAGVLQMLRWNGTTWTLEWTENRVQTTIDTGSMDGAYENSGEYVITWSSGLTTTELEYRRWTGSAWVASASYDVSSNTAAVTWVRMVSSPASGSYQDDLGMCYVSASTTTSVGCSVWNGTTNAWGNNKLMESNAGEGATAGTLDTSDLFYEQSSGRLIAAWGIELAGTEDSTEPQLGFDIFDPAVGWAASSAFAYDLGNNKEEPSNLKCAPMPTVSSTVKNNAICGGIDAASDDLSVFAWNGATNEFPQATAAWTVDGACVADATGMMRVAATWLVDGTNAVGVLSWGSGAATIEYARYINGTGWQVAQTFTPVSTATTDNNQVLFNNPHQKNKGILLVNDGNQDVFAYSLSLSGTTVTFADLNSGNAITKETGVTAGQPMALGYDRTIILEQVHYRWRNDNGTLTAATDISAEDIAASGSEALNVGTTYRLRFEVSNEGAATSSNDQWRLEFARKGASCTSLAAGWSWQQMPITPSVASDAFDMENSTNFTDGDSTGNNSGGDGGILTDADATFIAGQAKDTTSEISAPGITLSPENFTELEFAFKPNDYANTSATYCFRLTKAGSTDKITYTVYPETEVQIYVAPTLTLTIDAGTTTNFSSVIPGTRKTATTRLKVDTDNASGYQISVGRDRANPTTTLASSVNTSINISDTAGGINVFDDITTCSSTAVWVSGSSTGLGFTLWASSMDKNTTCWGGGTTETHASNKYATLQASAGASVFINTTSNSPNPSYASVGWSLDVSNLQQTTDYTGDVIFSATTNLP